VGGGAGGDGSGGGGGDVVGVLDGFLLVLVFFCVFSFCVCILFVLGLFSLLVGSELRFSLCCLFVLFVFIPFFFSDVVDGSVLFVF